MRRLTALVLFVVGYSLLAMLSPSVATLPAFAVFCVAGFVLVTRPEPADPAEAIAREILQRRR